MASITVYALVSVIMVSLVSFVGLLTLSINPSKLGKVLIYMISFSAGALLGDTFLHLIPKAIEEASFGVFGAIMIISGIALSLVVEKVIHWRHCHILTSDKHPHPFAIMNLFGDGVHNLLDGIIIGASYLVSIPVGVATTLAVIFHEIPQEIADFGVLIHGGFSKGRALFLNFITALSAVLGVVAVVVIGSSVEPLVIPLVFLAAGGFIYIAGSDLIPEMHKEVRITHSVIQVITFAAGVAVMVLLLGLE